VLLVLGRATLAAGFTDFLAAPLLFLVLSLFIVAPISGKIAAANCVYLLYSMAVTKARIYYSSICSPHSHTLYEPDIVETNIAFS